MKASEAVAQLTALLEQHGDHDIVNDGDFDLDGFEFSNDGDAPAFVAVFDD